jgi:NAD-dependent SIR2 family protein deacetylase
MNTDLINDYKDGKILLFVGAGVSADLGLPTWEELINQIANKLGYDPDVFKTYGDYLALAEYYRIKKGSICELTNRMDTEWHNPSIDVSNSKIHEYIAKNNFPIIYTTNYDNWIENAYECYGVKYNKIVKVSDISECIPFQKEVVKLHGDFSDSESIVLSETSYYQRLQFESPLDIKLRADILGKSVLFIGYSLQDINIRHLFYKLSNLWDNYGRGSDRPQSYLFSSKCNPIQEEVLKQWGIQTINSEIDNPGEALRDFLLRLISS